jgi:hypothetical protein
MKSLLIGFSLFLVTISAEAASTRVETNLPRQEVRGEGLGRTGSAGLVDLRNAFIITDQNGLKSALSNAAIMRLIIHSGTMVTLSSDITIPDGVVLEVENGGLLNLEKSANLTISGSVKAGTYRIFAGPGNVLVMRDAINAVWFATSGNGSLESRWAGWVAGVNAQGANRYISLPAGYYSMDAPLNAKEGVVIQGAGKRATDILAATNGITVPANNVTLAGFKLVHSGSAQKSVGLDVGRGGTGHHLTTRDIEIRNFDVGIRVQLTFYAGFYDVDSADNGTYNWHLTNSAISNDCFNCRGRGAALVSLRIDDTTSNSADNRFHGGTFEGAKVQQIDIVGADYTLISGTHIEAMPTKPLTGAVRIENESGTLTGTDTRFSTELIVGHYVKLDSDNSAAWMRVANVASDTVATLSEAYQGKGSAGAASLAAGLIRVADGAGGARQNNILNPHLGIAAGSTAGVYVEGGDSNIVMLGDANLAVILGVGAIRTTLLAGQISGGIVDVGKDSRVLASGNHGQFYLKRGTTKAFQVHTGGGETGLYSDQKWTLYVNGLPSLIVDGGTASEEIGITVRDYSAGKVRRIIRGPADSGGDGYRVLRVPN